MLRIEPKTIETHPQAAARMRGLGSGAEFSALLCERRPIRTNAARTHATRTSAAQMASPIEGLLALQGGEEAIAPEVRRRAARGMDLLDALDALRRETLLGDDAGGTLEALGDQLAALGPATHDTGLERVMQALELRVRVELAKRETAAKDR